MAEEAVFDLTRYQFYEVARVEDLPNGERLFIEVDTESIVIFNIAGHFFAIADICTHDGGPLGDGDIDGYQVICPRHGARFDVRNGKAVALPAFIDVPAYPVRVVDGNIEIGVPTST